MAGSHFDFRMEGDRELRRALNRFIQRAQNLKPVFSDIGEMLLLSHRERWDDEVAPDGTPWEQLSDKYKASKRKRESNGHDKILVLDTFLRDDGLSYSAAHSGLEFGTDKIYGATHQFGDPDRNIPARPFLGISDDDETEILEIISVWLKG